MDTGIRSSHVELSDVSAICGFNAIQDETCDDLRGHGTHVAGIVASKTYGVAKQVNLVSVKVLDRSGNGDITGAIAGLDYIIAQKLDKPDTPMVVNMSLAGDLDASFNEATAKAVDAGIVVVVAAGNDSSDACYGSPASVKTAITVGAAEKASGSSGFLWMKTRDVRASYSNYGPCVDIFAWGTKVVSLGITSDTATASKSGTSMSCPHVSGAAALYLQRDPTLRPAHVTTAMMIDASSRQLIWKYQNQSPNKMLNTKHID